MTTAVERVTLGLSLIFAAASARAAGPQVEILGVAFQGDGCPPEESHYELSEQGDRIDLKLTRFRVRASLGHESCTALLHLRVPEGTQVRLPRISHGGVVKITAEGTAMLHAIYSFKANDQASYTLAKAKRWRRGADEAFQLDHALTGVASACGGDFKIALTTFIKLDTEELSRAHLKNSRLSLHLSYQACSEDDRES